MMDDDDYLVWSNEHRAWWGPNRIVLPALYLAIHPDRWPEPWE